MSGKIIDWSKLLSIVQPHEVQNKENRRHRKFKLQNGCVFFFS